MIPVFVIGGYLGAGKTTLLNALLSNARGVRYAVLVNDFGSVNIDAQMIASSGTQTIELTNGCSCCTIGGDLILALKTLVERADPPERIAIEASGVADPRAVARLAAAHPELSVRGTIVLADAETILARAGDKYVGGLVLRQLGAGDALVLSKIDLIDAPQMAAVRAWLARTIPGVPVFESVKGQGFPDELLLDPQFLREVREEIESSGTHDRTMFATATIRSDTPLDRTAFLAAVRTIVPHVVRAKGTVYFADAPETCYHFQLVGERWSLEQFATPERAPLTQIVVIALSEGSTP